MMAFSPNYYKATGWIDINEELPDFDVDVKLIRTSSIDDYLKTTEWESIGKYRNLGHRTLWAIKATEGLKLGNSIPTHWKPLEDNRLEKIREWLYGDV